LQRILWILFPVLVLGLTLVLGLGLKLTFLSYLV
jgi:hypothetical protein